MRKIPSRECTFESDLAKFAQKMKDDRLYAVNVYRALCNQEWINVDQAPENFKEVLTKAYKRWKADMDSTWRKLCRNFPRWLCPKIGDKWRKIKGWLIILDIKYGCGAHYPNFTWMYCCSWRYAGGLVADIRENGESYIDFYCSGREGEIDQEVLDDLSTLGWVPLDDECAEFIDGAHK